jgi:hypothetical protein
MAVDDARRHDDAMVEGRLWMLTGAPGSGKTALRGVLRDLLTGMVVIDMDDFIEPASALAGVDLRRDEARGKWPAYNDLCLAMVTSVLGSGADCLLLSPLTPDEVEASQLRPQLPERIRWGVLECAEGPRRERLEARGLGEDSVREAVADAADLRRLGAPVIPADDDLAATAAAVRAWVEGAR